MLTKTKLFKHTLLATAVAMVPLSASAAVLEELIVTAQKTAQNINDVPISMDVLKGDDLTTNAINDTTSLAMSSPSLTFQEGFNASSSSFAIRGIGTYAYEGGIQPSVSFVVDDVPLSRTAEFVSDLGDIERVEILRGPQGTLYGRNSIAGAISVIRARPTYDFEGYAEQTVTTDDEYITRLTVSGPLTDNVRGRLSGLHKDREGHIENVFNGEELGGERTSAVLGKLAIDFTDSINLLLTGEYRDTDATAVATVAEAESGHGLDPATDGALNYVGNLRTAALGGYLGGGAGMGTPEFAAALAAGKKIIDDPFKTAQDGPGEQDIRNHGFVADLTVEINDELIFKSLTGYRKYQIQSALDIEYSPSSVTNDGDLPVTFALRTNLSPLGNSQPIQFDLEYFSQELRFEGVTDTMDWVAGVYYSDTDEASIAEIVTYVPSQGLIINDPRTGKGNWKGGAIFGDMTVQITDTLSVFGGLRWTVEDLTVDMNRQAYRSPVGSGGVVLDDENVYIDLDTVLPFVKFLEDNGLAPVGALGLVDNQVFKKKDRSENWTGRLGLNWDMNEELRVYTSVSRGFVGAAGNLSRASTPDNYSLDPSVSHAVELGVKGVMFDNSVQLNAAIFWQELTDIQSSALVPGTVQSVLLNAGNMETVGFEGNVSWAATEMLTLDAAMVYLDTEIQDLIQPCYPGQTVAKGCVAGSQDVEGNNMIAAPELSYNISARLDFALDSMPFSAYMVTTYTWQDEFQHSLIYDPKNVEDSYGLLDVVFGIEDHEGRYSLSVFGKNVTDEYFASSRSAAENTQGRVLTRTSRNAQAYYGIRARYNF
ncbi:MAG: TonB-dependent receptor [Spongiibacteraceae bacterium]